MLSKEWNSMISKDYTDKKLVIKPVLIYAIYERKKATSWRSWGGIQTKSDVAKEIQRISAELKELETRAEFPIEILSLTPIASEDEVFNIKDRDSADVILTYAAGGETEILLALQSLKKQNLIFLRHKSGPFYLWSEVIQARFLRNYTDELVQSNVTPDDVIVDDYDEVLWRLRALYGLKNTVETRIVTIGEPSGWPGESIDTIKNIPYLAKQRWGIDIKTVTYPRFTELLKKFVEDDAHLKQAGRDAEQYLSQPNITLHTDKEFVVKAFVVYRIFKDILDEYQANAITIDQCMSTIIPIAGTTACLPLSLLNDEGHMAFCESDFVVIPAGILLHYISGKPVFLNDPTYPHDGMVTLAHCTAPRKMDGESYEKTDIVTHFESDYGAAPSVKMRKGQEITVIDPDFEEKHWIGFKGSIVEPTSYPICRSQIDVAIEGDWKRLLYEMRGFHWIAAYGNYLKEIEYAVKKVGLEWDTI